MTSNPYIKETVVDRSSIGNPTPRIDREFLNATFCQALAKALGATTEATEERYAIGVINIDSDITIAVHSMHGAKMGRVEIFAGSDVGRSLEHHQRPNMPSATFDTARPVEAIAKAVRKHLVDTARPLVEGMRVKAAERADEAASLGKLIEQMRKDFPTASFNRREDRDLTADVYLNVTAGYATGTLYPDGRISFQRVSANTADASAAILRAIIDG